VQKIKNLCFQKTSAGSIVVSAFAYHHNFPVILDYQGKWLHWGRLLVDVLLFLLDVVCHRREVLVVAE
jgi:hypothetical protein